MNETDVEVAQDDESLEQAVRQLAGDCELENVALVEFSGERMAPFDADSVELKSQNKVAIQPGAMAGRFEWSLILKNEEADRDVATLSATVVVEYSLSDDAFVPDRRPSEVFLQTTGLFAAYPYLREFFQSSCARMQLNPLILGNLLRGETSPNSINSPRAQIPVKASEEAESSHS